MEPEVILDDKAKEAVHAARDAAQAVEIARQGQLDSAATNAAHLAATLASESVANKIVDEQRISEIVEERMRFVLTQGTEDKREAIIARIPYVCEDIRNINLTLKEIKENLTYVPLIQKMVFGAATMILVAVATALIALVVVK